MGDWPTLPARNPDEAIARLGPDSFWKLDETTGSFLDSGSAAISGTQVSGSRGRKGYRASRAAETTLDTAVATFGDNYRFANRAPFTVLVLHLPTTFATSGRRLVCKQNSGETSGWQMFYDTSGIIGLSRATAAGTASADFGASVNDWNLSAGIYDGTTLGTYFNGAYKLALADANNLTGTSDVLRINGTTADTASRGAVGRYDCLAIWNRALTQAEFDTIWAAM